MAGQFVLQIDWATVVAVIGLLACLATMVVYRRRERSYLTTSAKHSEDQNTRSRCEKRIASVERADTINISRPMSDEQFYINYSRNGEHFIMGPYRSRRFAMSHIDDVKRQPGVSNVFLGKQPPDERPHRRLRPITAVEEG
jgi:hypothetical protein